MRNTYKILKEKPVVPYMGQISLPGRGRLFWLSLRDLSVWKKKNPFKPKLPK